MYDYMIQFNTLAQYGSYHIDTNEKKANLFRNGHTIQLQDCLVQSPNLSYKDLASAAIDQERTMKACAVAEGKKRIMPGSSESGGSSSAPLKYHMVYTQLQDSCIILDSSIGAITCSSSNTSSNTTVFLPHSCSK
jgi:hypothetical protein